MTFEFDRAKRGNVPELPEVETIKTQLKNKIIGLNIKDIKVFKKKLFVGDLKDILGAKIVGVRRRAKQLIIDFDNHQHLFIHLKMSGQIIYSFKNITQKHTHIIIQLSNGLSLFYNDVRQFGWMKLLDDKNLKKELFKFGPEPLGKDFSWEILKNNLLKHKNLKIKPTLMDQSVVSGIGNIYASEICFLSKIRPERKIKDLGDQDFKNLFLAINKILRLAIKYKGTSADAYLTAEGKEGNYYKHRLVYDREGEPCPNDCDKTIKKIKLNGRGTYFCPICQH